MSERSSPKILGAVSPSAPCTYASQREMREERLQRCASMLLSEGIELKLSAYSRECTGYMAGTATQRLEDLHAMYSDPNVKWLVANRGGRNSNQLLERLDFDLIRRVNKPLIGYSDITVLLNAIYVRTGHVQIHGPMASVELESNDKTTRESFLAALNSRDQRFSMRDFGEVWKSGSAKGVLLGGNLMSLETLLGTPYEPDWSGAVFFWEEVSEPISRLDRTLTHFKHAGVWDKVAGVIIGHLEDIKGDSAEEAEYAKNVDGYLKNFFSQFSVPCIKTNLFGHEVTTQLSLPVGGIATISDSEVSFSFEKI